MKENILPAIKLTVICLVFFSGIYTLAIYGAAQFAPNGGKGDVTFVGNKKYYTNVAQSFTEDKYFWSRPSAVDYNAAGSGGSNKGPSNPDYLAIVQSRIDTFMMHNPEIKKSEIPSDIVTASGAGLDPNISVQSALVQIKRIAKARSLSEFVIRQVVEKVIEQPLLGILGTEKVNVLKLNTELDKIK